MSSQKCHPALCLKTASSNAVPSQRPSMQSCMCLYSSACNPRLCFYSAHVLPYCFSTVCHPMLCIYRVHVIQMLCLNSENVIPYIYCALTVCMSHILYVQVFFHPPTMLCSQQGECRPIYHGCISIADLSANAVSRCVVPGDQCYVSKMCCAMHDSQSLYL
jgi:hypothetical protein